MTEKLPARIAFTRLAMETADEATFLARLASLPQGDAVRTLGAIYPDGWRTVRQVLAAVDHSMKGATPTDYVRSVGAMFDRAATLSPIWNEPNNKSHWDPEIDPDWSKFAEMAKLTADAIEQANPRILRMVGGMSPIDPEFLRRA